MQSFYHVLGLSPRAESEDIKAAYRKLAKLSHPDLNAGDSRAEARFKEIKRAYDILRDCERRSAYDHYLARERAEARRRIRREAARLTAAFIITFCSVSAALVSRRDGGEPVLRSSHESLAANRPGSSRPPAAAPERLLNEVDRAASIATPQATGTSLRSPLLPPPGSRSRPSRTHLASAAAFAPGEMPLIVPPPPAKNSDVALAGADGNEPAQPARLLGQGERFFAQGDIAIARAYFIRAAELGLPVAALKMAETHDPHELARPNVHGLKPDLAEARKWYARAAELRVPGAEARLRRLDGR